MNEKLKDLIADAAGRIQAGEDKRGKKPNKRS
jgi:hypothetical protein